MFRYWSDWASIERAPETLYTAPAAYVGSPAPYLNSNDDADSYVRFTQVPGADYSTPVVLRFPTGIDLSSLLWQGGTYDATTLPGNPPQESNTSFWRMEVAQRLRFTGAEPASGTRPRVLHAFAVWDGAQWNTSGPFDLYESPWHTTWETAYTGRTSSQVALDYWQGVADAGNLGLWIRWQNIALTVGEQWGTDLSWVSLVSPDQPATTGVYKVRKIDGTWYTLGSGSQAKIRALDGSWYVENVTGAQAKVRLAAGSMGPGVDFGKE